MGEIEYLRSFIDSTLILVSDRPRFRVQKKAILFSTESVNLTPDPLSDSFTARFLL